MAAKARNHKRARNFIVSLPLLPTGTLVLHADEFKKKAQRLERLERPERLERFKRRERFEPNVELFNKGL
jgi:hypothetical protein